MPLPIRNALSRRTWSRRTRSRRTWGHQGKGLMLFWGLMLVLVSGCTSASEKSSALGRWMANWPNPLEGDRPRPLARVEQLAQAGKTPKIYVKGEVVSLSPLLSGLAYEIEDATGSLWIQSQRRDVALGETLHVQGILRRRNTEVAGLKFSEVYLEERRRVED